MEDALAANVVRLVAHGVDEVRFCFCVMRCCMHRTMWFMNMEALSLDILINVLVFHVQF